MTEEVQTLAEVDSAPAPEATAAPEVANATPEATEEQVENKPTKTFSQEEVDALIGKRLAREQRKWEREQQVKAQAAQPPVPTEIPTADQFDSPQAYADFIRKEAEKLVQHQEIQRQRMQIEETYAEREEEARSKYDDFEQVAYNPNVRITDVMAETIKASDQGPDLAYWLGSNPKEADRIARLSPLLQAREIGKIEAKLSAEPPVKKTTSAPAPITPVTARASGNSSYDTTDPRSIKSMATSEWIEAERQRQMRKLQAQQSR